MENIYTAMRKALGVTNDTLAPELVKRRLVPLPERITAESIDGLNETLIALDLKEVAPITLMIASDGGNVTHGKYISGAIQSIRSPVDGLVVERAASMAVNILQMCRERRALPCATFFVHFIRCSFEVIRDSDEITPADMIALKRIMTADKKYLEELCARRTGKTVAEINELFRLGEKYKCEYTAEDALKLGFIDRIDTTFKIWDTPVEKPK